MGKKKTKNEPWAPAQPYIIKGMEQTSEVFDQNQPMLQQMSKTAQDAFNTVAPGAFGTNPFVANAQQSAGAVGSGALLGANSGQATYDRLQGPNRDPSTGLLTSMAKNRSGGAGDATLSGLTTARAGLGDSSLSKLTSGGSNPGDKFASAVSGGKYLGAQPSSTMYAAMMDPSYSTANPYLDAMIKQSQESVTKAANQRFGAAGMGAGLSTAFGNVLSRNLSNGENSLRYQNYSDSENRRLQAGGQSDAAWSGERGRMDASTGLLSSNYNAGQDRALSAAQALNQSGQAQQQTQLSAAQALNQSGQQGDQTRLAAAQALGTQYGQGQDRALDAARAGDAAQQSQVQQMLTALGLTGELRNAEYAGVAPALSLLNSAADIPYVGVGALNGNIRQASNGYGTTTTSGGLGQQLLGAGAQLGSAYLGGK